MEGAGVYAPNRFGVYQNAALSSALAARPSGNCGLRAIIASIVLLVSWFFLSASFGTEAVQDMVNVLGLSYPVAKTMVGFSQMVFTLVFIGSFLAIISAVIPETTERLTSQLTPRQETLVGRRSSKTTTPGKPRTSPRPVSPNVMFPLHTPISKVGAVSPTTPLPVSIFPYTSVSASPDVTFNPWGLNKEDVRNEEQLEDFLSSVDRKMAQSSGRASSKTPPVVHSPLRPILGSNGTPSTGNTPPLRQVRMSPSSQKTGVSPKKAEGDLPTPSTIEQAIDGFRKVGVWPDIEQWRDGLRQWFSDVLLGPLLRKIDRSHLQVMETAAKIGCPIVVSPIGGRGSSSTPAAMDGSGQEWLSTYSPDEDALIHQFRAQLLNAKNATTAAFSIFGLNKQDSTPNPPLQACLDAVTEHQRLRALVKGEWVKGLLPQSSVRSDYTVQRLRELAEGSCVRNFEFAGAGEVYDKTTKKWTLELPTDAHLLVYLFCAYLEHPQWMLHVDPVSHPSTQSGNNPLFIASLPQKERFPERYVAVLSSAPPVLHSGACILAVGKQSPPVFALYWDKRLQFSLQGRTALWDAILLFCYRIKVAHAGIVRGVNLGGSAFHLLQLLQQRQT